MNYRKMTDYFLLAQGLMCIDTSMFFFCCVLYKFGWSVPIMQLTHTDTNDNFFILYLFFRTFNAYYYVYILQSF